MNNKIKNENLVVYGLFASRAQLENAVDVLKLNGFRNEDVSVLFSSPETSKEFAHTNQTKAPEGAAVGGSSGAIIGGVLGWLAGIGTIAIPGAGPFIAAGPIMAALAGIGAGGVVGGVAGALIGLGIPEYEAKRYEGHIKNGGILLSVHADNSEWRSRARKILEEANATDISSSSESSADYPSDGTPRAYNL